MGDFAAARILFNIEGNIYVKNKNNNTIITLRDCSLSSIDFAWFKRYFERHLELQYIMTLELPEDIKRYICSFVSLPELNRENIPNSCEYHNKYVDYMCPNCEDCPVCRIEERDYMYEDDYSSGFYYSSGFQYKCEKCRYLVSDGRWPDEIN